MNARKRIFGAETLLAAVIATPSIGQVHDACKRLPQWQSAREPKPYVMYSLRHGVNLSRRACRMTRMLLLVLLLLAGTSTSLPYRENTMPKPDNGPPPADYKEPFAGMDFSPMGPKTSTETLNPEIKENAGKPERYEVASVNFQRVKTPFIIGLWIFCASLAKIGKPVKMFCLQSI